MTPEALVALLQATPYRPGGGDWSGCDCWGLVEIWHRERFGIVLDDRAGHPAGPQGLADGFEQRSRWLTLDAPRNDALAVMRSGRLQAGHCGIVWNGAVLHTDEKTGCCLHPLSSRLIAPRLTGFLLFAGLK
jgi:cell wall-associated NlpC family hydrolase